MGQTKPVYFPGLYGQLLMKETVGMTFCCNYEDLPLLPDGYSWLDIFSHSTGPTYMIVEDMTVGPTEGPEDEVYPDR
jgi:hypothetical protein